MFKNYLLLSLKVLKRKPFYTFVSLFGISFTLMILMLITSLFDASLGANQPLTHRDRLVISPNLQRLRTEIDTIITIDSISMRDGTMRYDTIESYEDDVTSNSNGPMSFKFADENLRNFENVEEMALFNSENHVDGYLEGRKFSFNIYYVSASYYDVLDFEFVAGSRLLPEDEQQANKVVIITDKSSVAYFGESGPSVIGREMQLGKEVFKVRGIIARPLSDSPLFSGDIYVPLTTLDNRALSSEELYGGFSAIFLTPAPGNRDALKEEINFMSENFQLPPESFYTSINLMNAKFLEGYAMGLLQEENHEKAVRLLFIPIIILLILFLALPLLNLVNLNIGRVYERQSEIGVRKAFGANARDILYQFVFENMVITLIGGIIGMVLASLLITYINANDLLGITRLAYSGKVIIYFIIMILVFGFFSGILPAYRMSRANVADSLR